MKRKPQPQLPKDNRGHQSLRSERINLGLALLQLRCIYGEPLTTQDQSIWCDCTKQAMDIIFQRAMKKLRTALMFRDRTLWDELLLHLPTARKPAKRTSTHENTD